MKKLNLSPGSSRNPSPEINNQRPRQKQSKERSSSNNKSGLLVNKYYRAGTSAQPAHKKDAHPNKIKLNKPTVSIGKINASTTVASAVSTGRN